MKTRHFAGIPAIPFEGPGTDNPLAFRHYNSAEVIDGKTMKAHMRFGIAYWHSFRGTGADPFGPGTITRPWEKGKNELAVAKTRMDAAFEFFQKIDAPYWCWHDRDIAPEGVMGDATKGTAAKGERWLKAALDDVAVQIRELLQRP